MNTATFTSLRFAIVNARGTLADDLGASPVFASEEAADEAVESLTASGFEMDGYSVRELRSTDLVGEERAELLRAVEAEGESCARAAVEAGGSHDPDADMMDGDRAALDAVLLSRFGAELAGRDEDLWRAWRRGQEAGSAAESEDGAEVECAYCGATHTPSATVPSRDDDAAWTALAKNHGTDCEWIATRAHTVEVVRVFLDGAPSEDWANTAFYTLRESGVWVREGVDGCTSWEECSGFEDGEEYVAMRAESIAAAAETLSEHGYRVTGG